MANFPPRSGQMLAEVVQGGCGFSVLGDLQRPRAHSSLRPARGERAGAEGLAQRTSTGPFQPHPPVWLCALLFLLKPLSSAPMPAGKGAGEGTIPISSPRVHPSTSAPHSTRPYGRHSQEREKILLLSTPAAGAQKSQLFSR